MKEQNSFFTQFLMQINFCNYKFSATILSITENNLNDTTFLSDRLEELGI